MQVQVKQRRVIQIIRAEVMSDRPEFPAYSLGRHNLGDGIDPFIQLDHFYMRAPIFPPHPTLDFLPSLTCSRIQQGHFKIGVVWAIAPSFIPAICIGLRRGVV
jgi:hypothetical protein